MKNKTEVCIALAEKFYKLKGEQNFNADQLASLANVFDSEFPGFDLTPKQIANRLVDHGYLPGMRVVPARDLVTNPLTGSKKAIYRITGFHYIVEGSADSAEILARHYEYYNSKKCAADAGKDRADNELKSLGIHLEAKQLKTATRIHIR